MAFLTAANRIVDDMDMWRGQKRYAGHFESGFRASQHSGTNANSLILCAGKDHDARNQSICYVELVTRVFSIGARLRNDPKNIRAEHSSADLAGFPKCVSARPTSYC